VNFPRQNPRRRCIEGVISLLEEGKSFSFDVIKDTVMDEMYFQVFKKNQIGGAREILILPIEKRITINILESFARLICKDDEREMLTHGDSKLTIMREMVRDVRRTDDMKRIVLNYNLDKTRWGPSFMPIQFIYMFKPFAHNYKSLYNFLLLTLMVHTNKKCLIPEKLLHVWLKDPENKIKHSETVLQNLKEKFLETHRLSFDNESNMGQGILHYTSSYLHLCCLSFRDYIYRRLCDKHNISSGVWKDIVSSDDSYTAQALPMDNVMLVNKRINLFIKAQETSERLFNMWTSKSKSSISFLISEFNSMFGSNLTLFPTLFKFALSSVMPNNTDSFFRMVKESYNTSRQIVENGGSLELYMIAHRLNKNFCESVYHTNIGGHNDFKSFDLKRANVPYQLGVYPISDPGVMLILGPECHNYNILSRLHELSDREKNLFRSCHNLIPVSNPELYSDMNKFDNIFTGMLRIEAAVGPVRKLQRIKRQIPWSWDEMQSMIDSDITILIRTPKTLDEIKLATYQKLFSFGASESLRDTASSIYYARVAATVSAHAFHIPYHDEMSSKYDSKTRERLGFTYSECLNFLLDYKNDTFDLSQYYPHIREFNDLKNLSYPNLVYNKRNPYETQNVRSLQMTEITMRIKNPIRDLIEAFWVNTTMGKPTSYLRDWVTLKELVSIIDDTLEGTLENFNGSRPQRIRMLLLVLMRIMSHSNKPMKAVLYGTSTRTYDQTYLTLIQQNLYHNYTSSTFVINQNPNSNPRFYDKLFYHYNIFILSLWNNRKYKIDDYRGLNIDEYLRDPNFSYIMKKKIMIMLMYQGILNNYSEWTHQTKTIMHYWIKRQKRDAHGNYDAKANFKIKVQCGSHKMILERYTKRYYITVSEFRDTYLNSELLKTACDLVQITQDEVKKNMLKGRFLILDDQIVGIKDPNGYDIKMDNIPDIRIDVGQTVIERSEESQMLVIYDVDGYQIMRTPVGLLPTDYIPLDGEIEDFDINGLSILKLSDVRIFTAHFDFDHLDYDTQLKLLDDLDVPRPRVSEVTKKRLQGLISGSWETKGMSEYFDESEDKFEEEKMMNLLRETKVDESALDFLNEEVSDDPYDLFLFGDDQIGLINNLPTVKAKYQTQKIWDRVLFCKYHLITRCCIDPRSLSKTAMIMIYKQTSNINIIYSLVYVYDKLYTLNDAPSPQFVSYYMDEKFLNKFDLRGEEYNLY